MEYRKITHSIDYFGKNIGLTSGLGISHACARGSFSCSGCFTLHMGWSLIPCESGQQYYVMQPTVGPTILCDATNLAVKKKRVLWFSLENAPLKISSLRIIRTRMHSCICSYNRICEDLCKSYHPRKKKISLVSKSLSLWSLFLSLWADCNIISPYIATGHRCCWSFPAICTIRHQYKT